jgi:hypothetical protein
MWRFHQDRMHLWEWKLHRDRTPDYGYCTKCGAEKHWDSERHKWGAAMLKDFRKPFCSAKDPA